MNSTEHDGGEVAGAYARASGGHFDAWLLADCIARHPEQRLALLRCATQQLLATASSKQKPSTGCG